MTKYYVKGGLAVLLILIVQLAFSQKTVPKKQNEKLQSVEQNAVADNVIMDDLVVIGSACIGNDCADGESFGFHTILVKENNNRIGFEDTSSSLNFGTRDWEIEINASVNGGGEYFAINDIESDSTSTTPFKIEANAPTNSLYVNGSGRIGIGTATPMVGIHRTFGNAPAVRLEQDGSSGFIPQIWDMAGNEANFFIRDVTHGSKLPFRILPDAPSNSIYIAANGSIGLGTNSPSQPLHIKSANPNILLDGSDHDWLFNVNDDLMQIQLDSLTKISIDSLNVYIKGAVLPQASLPSDRRLKSDISPFANAGDLLKRLTPKTFEYDLTAFPNYGFPKGTQYGLIAQEVEKVLPDYVTEVGFPDGKQFKTVNYMGLIPILVQSNKEQQVEIERQRVEIEQLKRGISKFETLESRFIALEARLEKKEVNTSIKTDEK
jgi:hypothetical protein